MTGRISLALVLHNHQPVGNFGWVFEEVYGQAYEPMVAALERHPGVRLGLHYSGPLLDWIAANHAEFLGRLHQLSARGQVEILGGAYYEPILASLPQRDRHGQLVHMANVLEATFGRRPRGAWLAERVWEPSLPTDLVDAGYAWTILDDNHLRAASVPEDAMWGSYTTDDQGRLLTIFGTEQGLRYRIPFRDVDELIGYLRDHSTPDGDRVGMMGDDGEKFGAWPGTYQHCWGDHGWVERCFAALEANADWLTTVTPSAWIDRREPVGRIYVPTASYVEMTEWALPPDDAPVFHDLLRRARENGLAEARFLRGGMWRNFQARYREINDLHKQMLRVSSKAAALPPGDARDRALAHLYQGQSNDCYWHGLFGGIYIVHMRMATLAHLIAAEDLADATLATVSTATLDDVDLDGVPEAFLAAPGQVLVVDLAEGAGIGSWDLRASRVALASVMRRRPEAYHQTLRDHGTAANGHGAGDAPGDTATPDAAGATEAPRTIHDMVRVKEPGLAQLLDYDRYERRSGLVHLLPNEGGGDGREPLEFARGRGHEDGDFFDGRFELVALRPGELEVRREGRIHEGAGLLPVVVTKHLSLAGSRACPSLRLTVEVENGGQEAFRRELALEWNLNLLGGGGNRAAYYRVPGADQRMPHDSRGDTPDCAALEFGNDDEGVRISVTPSPVARATWFPVETVSNSEAGFERSYQGSCLLFRWPLALAPGERRRFSAEFSVDQAHDRTRDELASSRVDTSAAVPGETRRVTASVA